MRKNYLQYLWMIFLFLLLCSLLIWGIIFVPKVDDKIKIFGIVAVIMAAFTSVLTVTINNRKAKEREYDLHVLKEKQKVYNHFYNTLFVLFSKDKKNKDGLSNRAISEMTQFKQGLMNWGSENLIKEFIKYDSSLVPGREPFEVLIDGDKFLKELRKEMGFNDSKDLSLMSIILDNNARNVLLNKKQ
ncbi:hypothetical protein H2O64_23645 [Kordia sp. YSTF-M3]|uniref:Uncharacterized protein n=1 Tax=Kordia aestuariivivens TaxID=2759037 RepID=A0ABR7QGR0_9FLAO|nr:hypothetical protein [Kordia aestuariivivens]MBC8757683.1 hypothetical protein [Kordia aestuariivivens]